MKNIGSGYLVPALLFCFATSASAAPAASPSPGGASVQTGGGRAPSRQGPSAWGILPWSGFGVGVRYMLPLDVEPVLSEVTLRDSFALEFGADLLHHSYSYSYGYGYYGNAYRYSWTQVVPVAGVLWNLWFSDRFAIYPKAELGYGFGWFSGWDNRWSNRPSHGGVFLNGAIGAHYRTKKDLTLRAEAGYAGLKLGVGWLF
jgi:hypothetical protein